MAAWVQKNINGPVFKVSAHHRFEKYLNDHPVVVIYFGNDKQDLSIFDSVAKNYQHIVFLSAQDKSLQSTYG